MTSSKALPMTEMLFRDDAYLATAEAKVLDVDEAGILIDRSVFYATGGGQPGDVGEIEFSDGAKTAITTAIYGDGAKTEVRLVAAEGARLPAVGETIVQHVDWANRYKLMRMHTALHLLSVVLPFPVTGGQIGAEEGRLDFDMPEGGIDKEEVTARINAEIAADHPVSFEWITDAELDANPGLVKTMKVQPPRGSGRVRLVRIGTDLDLQPCGGTHVKSTSEIGDVHVGKVEKKGKINRRVRLRFGPAPV
ncbi:Alanine-tRNA ligase [Hartmannibacter diazotrophicus]|uniref:Alanine--tRNA ligase n=1 Tax=Hartmannibacter diazotrophicus TaxID=1482074 RepID=A0A2C9D5S9_9HYPH|nr:alanyl-tRNA editing protein [Hartmannibacter diazotrophicus]SON55101.1 Alanine-tRNA ligase [Hartmannibacter diazotrophicus]